MEGGRNKRRLVVPVRMQDEPQAEESWKTPRVTLDKRREMGPVAKGAAKCLSLSL